MEINKLRKKIIDIFIKNKLNKDHATISANALINAELVASFAGTSACPFGGTLIFVAVLYPTA